MLTSNYNAADKKKFQGTFVRNGRDGLWRSDGTFTCLVWTMLGECWHINNLFLVPLCWASVNNSFWMCNLVVKKISVLYENVEQLKAWFCCLKNFVMSTQCLDREQNYLTNWQIVFCMDQMFNWIHTWTDLQKFICKLVIIFPGMPSSIQVERLSQTSPQSVTSVLKVA